MKYIHCHFSINKLKLCIFFLNLGGQIAIDGKNDAEDFESLQSALQVLSFSTEECETIHKILASILHLGNVYFHRKQLKHGYEG
jgi:myosin-15